MTIAEALKAAAIIPLDAELLLGHILNKNRAWLFAHGNEKIQARSLTKFQALVRQRKKGTSIAYILGTKEFYGRDFFVNQHVLVPRPATEGLIDACIELIRSSKKSATTIDRGIIAWTHHFDHHCPLSSTHYPLIVDVGTGSGCIAVTLALLLPRARFLAVDTSKAAIKIAKINARKHRVSARIRFVHGNGVDIVKSLKRPFLVVSNPPYVPRGMRVSVDVRSEPKQAVFAGKDGLRVLRPLLEAMQENPFCRGFAIECRRDQVLSIR